MCTCTYQGDLYEDWLRKFSLESTKTNEGTFKKLCESLKLFVFSDQIFFILIRKVKSTKSKEKKESPKLLDFSSGN